MLIAKLSKVQLRPIGRDEMTKAQHDFDTVLRGCTAASWDGNVMAVVAETEEEAAGLIAEQLRQYLGSRLRALQLKDSDLIFGIRYNRVENQKVWLSLSTFSGKSYSGDFIAGQE